VKAIMYQGHPQAVNIGTLSHALFGLLTLKYSNGSFDKQAFIYYALQ